MRRFFMKTYDETIDVKETVRAMKKHLLFLKQYSATLRLHSALYAQQGEELHIDDNLVDYLHYSKSIIHANGNHAYTINENEILTAMEKQRRNKKKAEQRDKQAYLLLEGIKQLSSDERSLLLDVYVRQLDKAIVLQHQGDVVESTLHRRLRRACLHLAMILQIEVIKE